MVGLTTVGRGDDWPGWRGANRDGVWREDGILEKFDSARLENGRIKLKWTTPVLGGYSGPSVADGRVFITDRRSESSPAMSIQQERIHALDAATGKILWTHAYDCHYGELGYQAGPRATVTVDSGRAYALGARGHITCLDAKSGKVHWHKDLEKLYKIRMPIWGIAAAPLVEKDLVILHIGGEHACLVALDRVTGEEKWKALDDRASYSAPIILEQAGQRIVVCWTGDNVVALNPATGAVHWQQPFKPTKMVIGIATPVVHQHRLFVTSFYDGAMMLELATDKLAAKQLWKKAGPSEQQTEALHSIISTPYLAGDHVYGVDSYGQLRCLDAKTGERIWEDLTATPKERWSNIHMVRHGERMWMFNELGELVIGTLSPQGFKELSRAKLIDPTRQQLPRRSGVTWSHPAYANRHVFVRNDKEIVCADLSAR